MSDGADQGLSSTWDVSTLRRRTEHSPDILLLVDLDARLVFVSRVSEGAEVESVLGTRVYDHLPEEQRDAQRMIFERVKSTLRSETVTNDVIVHSGALRTWESTIAPSIVDGELVGFSIFSRDVTERDERARDLHRFFELSWDYLSISTFDGYFTRVNQTFVRELGYTQEELLSISFHDLIHPDDLKHTQEAMARAWAGEPVVSCENRYRTKDGQYRTLMWHGRMEETTKRMLGVARDVTADRGPELPAA